jgi:hypothetical protein
MSMIKAKLEEMAARSAWNIADVRGDFENTAIYEELLWSIFDTPERAKRQVVIAMRETGRVNEDVFNGLMEIIRGFVREAGEIAGPGGIKAGSV